MKKGATVIVKIDRNGNFTNENVDEKEIYNKSLFNKEISVFILNDENPSFTSEEKF